jgi:hypothetical protein
MQKPPALVVFLENVGYVAGKSPPDLVMNTIDFLTEEYAKVLLHLYGAYRRYDRVVVLEDERATGAQLAAALLSASRTHIVDVLLLVHGNTGQLVGHKGNQRVGVETFDALRNAYRNDPQALDLRMVYGLNCYGLSLTQTWLELGAQAVNGSPGVNWFPEPSLSVFLRNWLRGKPYSEAVIASNTAASHWWGKILGKPKEQPQSEHPWICSSRQVVFGKKDVRLNLDS